jgi:cyclopropane fatty-acyl-phospholipid synthase-like methyltransferase
MHPTLKKKLVRFATHPYRSTGHFNYGWARGKLGHDPIFPAMIDQSVFPDGARVLDLGCGRGLLAAWMLAAENLAKERQLEDAFNPPKNLHFRGIEIMSNDVSCCNLALKPIYGDRVAFRTGDMREAELIDSDAIAILDVLHYISYTEQDLLLDRIRKSLPFGGLFITRIGNSSAGLRFSISSLVDSCISFVQGHRLKRMWCRRLDEWVLLLESKGFSVNAIPMSTGTPFANVMLICKVAREPINR